MWLDPVIAASVFLFSLVLAIVLYKLLVPVVLRFTHRTAYDLIYQILDAVRLPASVGIAVLGGYLALTVPLELSGGQQRALDTAGIILAIMIGVTAVASIISHSLNWYIENVAPRTQTGLDDQMLPLVRRIAVGGIYVLGGMLVLDALNVNISPIIAGLGLGGLAVALAIQPTLSNLFAGTYVMTEGVVKEGDYIELENGVAGYVIDVGWRSVRLRTWSNNLVVIPNSRFADTIMTNYNEPHPQVNVYLTCGVSYDSDLHRIEQVCNEVMDEVLNTNPNAVKEYGRYFGFESFGDSNVNFWLFIQARDRLASFDLQTALMESLHRRFNEEGIVINYPVRTLQFPDGMGPETAALRDIQQPWRGPRQRPGDDMPRQRYIPPDVTDSAGDGADGPGPDAG
jgi:small-conductance mechanosensitive channel